MFYFSAVHIIIMYSESLSIVSVKQKQAFQLDITSCVY